MKVVINRCYGGFRLSDKAIRRYAEIKGIKLYVEKVIMNYYATYYTVPKNERIKYSPEEWEKLPLEERQKIDEMLSKEILHCCDINRDDLALVQTVEELGQEANVKTSKLKVVEIPDDVKFIINEYDGMETIHEKHRVWY